MQRKKMQKPKKKIMNILQRKKNRSEFIIFRQNEFAHLIKLG